MKQDRWNDDNRHQTDNDTEFDRLIRWSLHDGVKNEEPPDRIWEKIQTSLNGGPLAYPEARRRASRTPFIVQAMSMAAMFLVLTGIIVNLNISPARQNQEWDALYSQTPIVMSAEDMPSGRLAFLNEREQRYMQRSLTPTADPILVHRRWGDQ